MNEDYNNNHTVNLLYQSNPDILKLGKYNVEFKLNIKLNRNQHRYAVYLIIHMLMYLHAFSNRNSLNKRDVYMLSKVALLCVVYFC